MRKYTVVYVINNLKMGGAESIVRDLSYFLKKKKWRVIIVTLFNNHDSINLNKDLEIYNLNFSKNLNSIIKAIKKFNFLIKNVNPELVHAHLFYSIIFTRLYRLFFKINILIATLHSSIESHNLIYFFLRITNFIGDLLTTVSTLAAKSLENKFVAKRNSIFVIPNGIDTNKFKPEENNLTKYQLDCLSFITIGRLTKYKNHQNLILAFSRLIKKFPNATLSIIGDGEEKSVLYSLISQLNLNNNIFLIGLSSNVSSYLKNANFYIHASLWEGFGLVLAEAMSSELVVISTNFDVAYEIIENCGIYTNGFTAEDLYESLYFACCLPISNRVELGKNARIRIINNFDISNMYLKYEMLYLRLLKNKI